MSDWGDGKNHPDDYVRLIAFQSASLFWTDRSTFLRMYLLASPRLTVRSSNRTKPPKS